jgi:hypothetical protein
VALTTQQQQEVASYYSQNAYAGPNATAWVPTDQLMTAISQIDSSLTVSATAVNASFSLSVSISGRFTLVQAEQLAAYVLLKRAGAI